MNKVKNIRQAFSIMKKRFPTGYVFAGTKLIRYTSGELRTEMSVYTDSHGGVWSMGKTWDEAIYNLERHITLESPNG